MAKLKLNAYLLFLAVFLVFFQGYQYGTWEQTFYLPILKKILFPGFLAGDWFVNLSTYHLNTLNLWAFLAKGLTLPWAAAVLYFAVILAYIYSTYYIGLELSKNTKIAAFSVFLLAVIIPQGLGGYQILQPVFVPGMLGVALLLFSLLYFLREKYLMTWLWGFLAAKAHLLLGLNWLLLLTPYYIYRTLRSRKINWKELLWITAAFLFLLLPDIVAQLKIILQHPIPPGLQRIFLDINVHLRYPQHYLLLYSGPFSLLYFALLVLSISQWGKKIKNEVLRAKVKYLNIALLVLVLINLVFVDIFPVVIIAKLQLLRITYLLEYLFLLLFASLAADKLKVILIFILPVFVFIFPENYKIITLIFAAVLLNNYFTGAQFKRVSLHMLIVFSILFFCLLANERLLARVDFYGPPHSDWLAVAEWAKKNTPRDALFIVPPQQEGFRAYAERAIVADFKACPYLEKDIAEWENRLNDLTAVPIRTLPARGFDLLPLLAVRYRALNTTYLKKLALKYGAAYLVTENRYLQFPLLFRNKTFAVYYIIN